MSDPGLVIFTHLRPQWVHLYYNALSAVNVRLVTLYRAGRSSTYRQLAKEYQKKHSGSSLSGVYARKGILTQPRFVVGASYSAGYGFWSEILKEDDPGLDGLVSIDSWYADEDADGTASDEDLKDLVLFAQDARLGSGVCWIGHGDVPVSGYASTGQVAQEVRRLAGEPDEGLCFRAHNVVQSHGAEHALALTQWGPGFLVEAVQALVDQIEEYD